MKNKIQAIKIAIPRLTFAKRINQTDTGTVFLFAIFRVLTLILWYELDIFLAYWVVSGYSISYRCYDEPSIICISLFFHCICIVCVLQF